MSAFTDAFSGLSKAKLVALMTAVTVLVAFVLFVGFRMSTSNMVPLFSNLSLEDSSKIIAELEKTNTPYELVGNGTQILVPSDKVLRMRMSLAEQALPSGGSVVGYEIFDRSDTLGSSNYVININMIRALEGELSRTIGSLAYVDNARVHLVVPKRELFSRDKDKPSAAVTIKMRSGHALESAEVTAITHLIASAVPALEPSRVTIVDSHGRLLARGDGDSQSVIASTAQEFKIAYETRTQQAVEDIIEKIVGPGKVRAHVAADIDFDRVVTNSEKYDPDGQVARSVQSSTERENAQDKAGKDNVTIANNQPGADAGGEGTTSSNKLAEHSNEITNFEISKTVQNHVREGGNVQKLSVAVLIDGVYGEDANGNATYTPRSEEELTKIRALAMSAIGFDEKRGDKIEVVNMRFSEEAKGGEPVSFFEKFKIEMQSIIQTFLIAVVAILAILLVLRPAVTQLIRQSQSPADRVSGELAAIGGPGGAAARLPSAGMAMGGGGMDAMPGSPAEPESEMLINVSNIKGGMKSSSMNKINEIVDKYPEETMGVLRQWVFANKTS